MEWDGKWSVTKVGGVRKSMGGSTTRRYFPTLFHQTGGEGLEKGEETERGEGKRWYLVDHHVWAMV